jgi:predicted dehydrogenase
MGYHVIDMVNRLFGPPTGVGAAFSYCFSEMERKLLDDVAVLAASYDSGLRGTIAISRHHYRRTEKLEVLGSRGAIVVTPTACRRYSRTGELRDEFVNHAAEEAALAAMFDSYLGSLEDRAFRARHLDHHVAVVDVTERAYCAQREREFA